MKDHRKEVAPLQDRMWQKRTELQALSVNPNTKPETLSALVAEMTEIRSQLHAKRDALETRVEQEVGIKLPPMGPGFGGMRGGHPMDENVGPEHRPGNRPDCPQNGPDA